MTTEVLNLQPNMCLGIPTWEMQAIESVQSDPTAFKQLYVKYYPVIFRFVFKRISDQDTVKDITSQVFVQALANISKYNFRGLPFSSWLFKIAQNEISGFYRKNSSRVYVDCTESGMEKLLIESEYGHEQKDMIGQMMKMLDTLKPDEMELIRLRFFEEMSFAEMAEVLNTNENNARVKTFRVIQKLQKKIQ